MNRHLPGDECWRLYSKLRSFLVVASPWLYGIFQSDTSIMRNRKKLSYSYAGPLTSRDSNGQVVWLVWSPKMPKGLRRPTFAEFLQAYQIECVED